MQEYCGNKVAVSTGGLLSGKLHNPTVGENLDARIKNLEEELDRMKKAKESLGPLLGMRIQDIRDAMNF
jgi:hypothetical protein